jgi:hypothetical protein
VKRDDDIDRSDDKATTTESNGTYIANSKVPKKLEPPQRDTGIPSELDINIDIDEGKKKSSYNRKKNENARALCGNPISIENALMTFYIALSLFLSLWFVSLSLWFSLNSNARR